MTFQRIWRGMLIVTVLGGVVAIIGGVASPQGRALAMTTARGRCVTPDRRQVRIPGGTFLMGSADFYKEESPVRRVTVAPFWIDRFAVTNAEFAQFVAATGYVTDAERQPDSKDYPDIPPDQLTPGGAVFTPRTDGKPLEAAMEWWHFVRGADWRHPYGPHSSIAGRDHEPVVQVSYRDALAYARWAGRELPTEAQYEYAARGGLEGKHYAWGDELTPGGHWMANTWQGVFPNQNIAADGYRGLAPVGCFPPNGYGLYDMMGNVWEWTASPAARSQTPPLPASRVERIVVKGGSFLCSANYCRRYRPAARQVQESGFSAMHLGFRTVRNQGPPP